MHPKKRIGLIACAAAVALLGASHMVNAYVHTGSSWDNSKVRSIHAFKDGNATTNSIWSSAITDWNNAGTPASFINGSRTSQDIRLSSIHDPATDNDGRAMWYFNGDHYTYSAYSWINTYYTNNYSSLKARSVASHELGHILGLEHETGAVLMNGNTADRYDRYNIYRPAADDRAGINALYQ